MCHRQKTAGLLAVFVLHSSWTPPITCNSVCIRPPPPPPHFITTTRHTTDMGEREKERDRGRETEGEGEREGEREREREGERERERERERKREKTKHGSQPVMDRIGLILLPRAPGHIGPRWTQDLLIRTCQH